MYEVVRILDTPLQQHIAMESASDVWYKHHAVIQFLVAEKESVRNFHKYLCDVYGSAAVHRSAVGHWMKRVTASETGKAELHDLPCLGRPVTAVIPEML